MKKFRVSIDEPDSSSDGSLIEAIDAEAAAETYVSRHHDIFDYGEHCEVWVRAESSLDAEEYTVIAEMEPVFRAVPETKGK